MILPEQAEAHVKIPLGEHPGSPRLLDTCWTVALSCSSYSSANAQVQLGPLKKRTNTTSSVCFADGLWCSYSGEQECLRKSSINMKTIHYSLYIQHFSLLCKFLMDIWSSNIQDSYNLIFQSLLLCPPSLIDAISNCSLEYILNINFGQVLRQFFINFVL